MNCIVVDDEPIAREGIANYISQIPFLNLMGKCKNAYEAIEMISENHIDLIFLDINMPNLNGIDMVNSLQQPPMIIFITAYSNYALKGFEVNAVDYILKPVSYSKFLKASQKAFHLFKLEQKETNTYDYIYIKVDRQLIKIEILNILFIEGLKDYILIHTKNKQYATYLSLNKILKTLSEKEFIQVHKSFIVKNNAIDLIEGNTINIKGNKIPIGRNYKSNLFKNIINKKYLTK